MTKNVFIAIIGRPNVGKSSLLNRLIGEKLAIVTSKPQTTRTRITGILTKDEIQFVFVDTPGMHKPRTRLGEHMTKTVRDSVADTDALLMLFEPDKEINEAELELIESLKAAGSPAIAAINKVDKINDKQALLEKIDEISKLGVFEEIVPISALNGDGTDKLLELIASKAIEGPHFFSQDHYTDIPEKQLVAEIVREKILQNMDKEIPHGTAVEIERFHEREDKNLVEIYVSIYCEKKSHKGMIIGKNGQMLKKIASSARLECEKMLGCKVHMECWVKVRKDWRDDEKMLNNLGFK